MPKVARRPLSVAGKALLAALVAWVVYILWKHPAPTIAFIALVAGWSLVSHRRDRTHLRALAAVRHGESICSFSRELGCRNVDTWVVRATYEEIQWHLAPLLPNFPLRCSDRLVEDLRMDPDDLDEMLAIDIAERTRRDFRNTRRNTYFGKVHTVRDLVMLFHEQLRLSEHSMNRFDGGNGVRPHL